MKLSTRVSTINGPGQVTDNWAILYAARARQAKGEAITMLCIGDHDTETPAPIRQALTQSLERGNTRYAAIDGAPALRQMIADRVAARTGVETGPQNVFVTNGGQGAFAGHQIP